MKNNTMDLLAYTGAFWKGKLYCLSRECNLLFSVNPEDGKTEFVDTIPEEDTLTTFICGIMTVWNDKLIFTPNKTKKIWIYDLISGQWDNVAIKECDDHCLDAGSFYQIYIYNDKIFLVGSGYPAILCVDLENKSCDYIEGPYKDMLTRHPDPDHIYFWYYGVQLENDLYLASCLDNQVLRFDMDTQEYHWIKMGDDGPGYQGIAWDGSNFWLSPRSGGDITKWDGKKEVTTLSLPGELKQHAEYIWGVCYDGKQIVLPATTHTNTILVNVQNDTLQIQKQQYSMYGQLDNGMIINQTINGDLSIITDGSSWKTCHTAIHTDQLQQFYKEKHLPVFKEKTLYHEDSWNSMLSLDSFLTFTKSQSETNVSSTGQVGKQIWEQIR